MSAETERLFDTLGLLSWQREVARQALSGRRFVLWMPRQHGRRRVEQAIRDAWALIEAIHAERHVRSIVASQRRRRHR